MTGDWSDIAGHSMSYELIDGISDIMLNPFTDHFLFSLFRKGLPM